MDSAARWCACFIGIVLLSISSLPDADGRKDQGHRPFSGGRGGGSGKCSPVPNVIPTDNKYNIKELMTSAPWYGYLTYNSDSGSVQNPTDVNVVNYYTSKGKSSEPTRSQQSEVILQEKRKYTDGRCTYNLDISEFTNDGRQIGPLVEVDSAGKIISDGYDSSIIWSTDQSTYVLFFWCAKHNWESDTCASTHLYVYTRSKPTELSKSDKNSINSAVNDVLKPYCLDTSKFAQYKWDKNMKECPPAKKPDCFKHYEKAYDSLIED